MKKTTILRSVFLLISSSMVLAFISMWFTFKGSVAATPAPESKSQEQIMDRLQSSDRIVENNSTSTSKRLESVPLNNPNVQTSDALDQNTFYSVADSTIFQGYPSLNLGSVVDMWAGYDEYLDPPGQIVRSLIFFDISSLPSNQNILGATLRIYLVESWDYPDTSRTISTYRIASNWAEHNVTWNNTPAFGEDYGSQSILPSAFDWHDYDMTNLVRSWYDGTYNNYGIMLRGPEVSGLDSSWRSFGTRESDYVPELVIQYETNISPPIIAGLPDQELLVDTNLDNAIDLWVHTNDSEDVDADLSFTINNSPNSSAGVSIDSNRYIDINPSTGWTGVTNVEIEVTDTDGLSDTDSFQVEVISGPSNSPPTIAGLPDRELPVNTNLNNAIDLWAYTNDTEDADAALSFTLNNSPNPGVGVSIDSNRYIDISPSPGWIGITNVAIEVMDTGGYSDIDSFQVEVIGARIFLPIVK